MVDYLVTHDNSSNNRSVTGYCEAQFVPNAKAAKQSSAARVIMGLRMEYGLDRSDIAEKYYSELNRVGKFLNSNPEVTATIQAHADNATPNDAPKISLERAQSLVDYLVDKTGVSRSRLRAQEIGLFHGYPCNTIDDARVRNRRVNIIINYPNLS